MRVKNKHKIKNYITLNFWLLKYKEHLSQELNIEQIKKLCKIFKEKFNIKSKRTIGRLIAKEC